ncbi:MAG TPA: hypothetical protein VNJ04_20860 [Gemmatimonadaceae bacterium]|nr:hypothetical protein [Gemmatimonadaceae bacterium]
MKAVKRVLRPLTLGAVFAFAAGFGCTPPPVPDSGAGNPPPPRSSSYPAELTPASSGKTWTRSRPGNCGGAACTVNIEIDVKAYKLFDPAHGRFNTIVASIKNSSAGTELKYGFKPSTVETYEIVARKGWTGPATIAVYRLPTAGGKYFVSEKVLRKCHDKPADSMFKPDVDFAEYNHPRGSPCMTAGAERPLVNYASMLPLARLAASLVQPAVVPGPMWIECGGCCS